MLKAAAEQLDAILGMANDALRARMETRIIEHREYRSEFFRKLQREGLAEAQAEGKAKGKAEDVLTVLEARGIAVTAAIRSRILKCGDATLLDTWLRRAVVATSAAEVVRDKAPPARRTAAPRKAATGTPRKPSTRTAEPQ